MEKRGRQGQIRLGLKDARQWQTTRCVSPSSSFLRRSHPRPVRKHSTSLTPAATPTSNGKPEVRNSKVDGVKISVTGDNTRDRCAELIYDGLACDSGARESPILPHTSSNPTVSQPVI